MNINIFAGKFSSDSNLREQHGSREIYQRQNQQSRDEGEQDQMEEASCVILKNVY